MMGSRINATQAAGYRGRGFSLIEVLVTILILMVGLLGLAGLQGRALTAQMESYQRSQALILLKDMADRINANRKNAASYVTAGLGTGAACPAVVAGNIASVDLNEWCEALLGAAAPARSSGRPHTLDTASRAPPARVRFASRPGPAKCRRARFRSRQRPCSS